VLVQQRDRAADMAIAQGAQPSRRSGRQRLEIAARGIDEDELARALEHGGAAGTAFARLRHRLVQQLRRPGTERAGGQEHLRREGGDQRIEGLQVACHEAADHDGARFVHRACHPGPQHPTVVGHRDGLGIVARDVAPVVVVFHRAQSRGAGDHMGVATREHHDVAGGHAHGRLAVGGGPAVALDHQVVGEHVLGPGHQRLGQQR